VTLVAQPVDRAWIEDHANIGQRGVIVAKGMGLWEWTVRWLDEDYDGEPIRGNHWQEFYVMEYDIMPITMRELRKVSTGKAGV